MRRTFLLIVVFAIAFACIESAVVVYLRMLYYPEGFSFPLKLIDHRIIRIELLREVATLVMLVAAGMLAGLTQWQRFSYIMITFGVWDIFYYVWLNVFLGWPGSLLDWDVLFLLPIPWIAPVLVPVIISLLLILAGVLIIRTEEREGRFRPSPLVWGLSIAGTLVVLFSFMVDTDATLHLQMPRPFRWDIFAAGVLLYIVSMILVFRKK